MRREVVDAVDEIVARIKIRPVRSEGDIDADGIGEMGPLRRAFHGGGEDFQIEIARDLAEVPKHGVAVLYLCRAGDAAAREERPARDACPAMRRLP